MPVTVYIPKPDNIAAFSLSRLWHFGLFKDLPFQSYEIGDPNPIICDLKVYQDYLMYAYIVANVPKGSRVLDVGGGDSRVLKFLSKEFECWSVDKGEGLGNGPENFTSPHYRIVSDYLGSFNPELPDAHFDFVFSISALEHTPEDQTIRENLVHDLHRVLKPGAPTFHLFDCILRPDGRSWVNGLVPYLYRTVEPTTYFVPPAAVEIDPTVYYMSEAAFTANWSPILKTSYADYGRPYSTNIFWRAPISSIAPPRIAGNASMQSSIQVPAC